MKIRWWINIKLFHTLLFHVYILHKFYFIVLLFSIYFLLNLLGPHIKVLMMTHLISLQQQFVMVISYEPCISAANTAQAKAQCIRNISWRINTLWAVIDAAWTRWHHVEVYVESSCFHQQAAPLLYKPMFRTICVCLVQLQSQLLVSLWHSECLTAFVSCLTWAAFEVTLCLCSRWRAYICSFWLFILIRRFGSISVHPSFLL